MHTKRIVTSPFVHLSASSRGFTGSVKEQQSQWGPELRVHVSSAILQKVQFYYLVEKLKLDNSQIRSAYTDPVSSKHQCSPCSFVRVAGTGWLSCITDKIVQV